MKKALGLRNSFWDEYRQKVKYLNVDLFDSSQLIQYFHEYMRMKKKVSLIVNDKLTENYYEVPQSIYRLFFAKTKSDFNQWSL